MNAKAHKALLPAGLADVLPPDAEFEAGMTEALMSHFARHGFERVKPPLLEFEENLIGGSGAATASQTFRLMDPISQRMMGLRADMTLQIARIAATRLSDVPRPLRLSYAGQVLRVRGSALRPERQFGQTGIELIGSSLPAADAEVILLAIQGLESRGITGLSVDLGLPTLVPILCAQHNLDLSAIGEEFRGALNQKDTAEIKALLGGNAAAFTALIDAVGPADEALPELRAIGMSGEAESELAQLEAVISILRTKMPEIRLTVDPVELRGYEYHSGLTFTVFAREITGELGRGGRYRTGPDTGGPEEDATGITLFVDSILKAAPAVVAAKRVCVPMDTGSDALEALHADGWITVSSLKDGTDSTDEARRLNCTHSLVNGVPKEV
jgi:ATP phosphoribosyltransferase regulatory subunit